MHSVWKDIHFSIISFASTLFDYNVHQLNGEEGIATRTLGNALTYFRS